MQYLSDGKELEVIRVCGMNPDRFKFCDSCGSCGCSQEEVKEYSFVEQDYFKRGNSKKIQENIDADIVRYMQEYGATREQVVEAMLEDDLERIKKGRG